MNAPFEYTRDEPESSASEIISKSLVSLKDKDFPVYELLVSEIRRGFFEKPQPKNSIQVLANKLVEKAEGFGYEDAR